MDLTKEQRQLKEAIKILLRDGKEGRLFEAAKTRYLNLKTEENIQALSQEIEGIDWSKEYKKDIEKIEEMIRKGSYSQDF